MYTFASETAEQVSAECPLDQPFIISSMPAVSSKLAQDFYMKLHSKFLEPHKVLVGGFWGEEVLESRAGVFWGKRF